MPKTKPQVEKPKENEQLKSAKQQVPANNELFSDTNVTMKSGHCVKDAEVVGEGKYVKLRIASNKQFENPHDGEIRTNTNFFDALISYHLKEQFDLAQTFKKGDWIYLKGEDSTKSFDTPEGYKQTASTIFAYHAVLKKEKTPEQSNTPKSETKNKSTKSTKPAVVEPA